MAPDPTVRNVEVIMPWPEKTSAKKTKQKPEKSFYSDEESSSVGLCHVQQHMSHVMRKPVFVGFNLVRLKPVCSASEAS